MMRFLLSGWLFLLAYTGKANQPVQFDFHGFESFKNYPYSFVEGRQEISPELQSAGLTDLLYGKGFYNALPYKVVNYIKLKKMEQMNDWKFRLYNSGISFFSNYFTWFEKFKFVSPLDQDGQFFVFGRTPSPPSRIFPEGLDQVKVGLTQSAFLKDGQIFTNNNCLSCHSGVAYGAKGALVVAGAGNNYIDQFSMMVEGVGTVELLEDHKFQEEMRAYLSQNSMHLTPLEEEQLHTFVKKIKTTVIPTFRFADSVGYNVGPFGVWALLARLIDPKNFGFETFAFKRNIRGDTNGDQQDWLRFKKVYGDQLSDDEIWVIYNKAYDEFDALRQKALAIQLPPVFPNAWFLRKYRKSWGYWYGDQYAGFDKYAGVHFAQNFTDEHPQVNEHHADHAKSISSILNFANSIQPPPYPGILDGELVKKGEKVFHENVCVGCHGTYKKNPEYVNRYDEVGHWIVNHTNGKLVNVGTDSKYNDVLQQFEAFEKEFEKIGKGRVVGLKEFWTRKGDANLGPNFSFPNRAGYRPPPLVGLWATAPYFHNGSVPELEQVLNSKLRPKVWSRIDLNDAEELKEKWGNQVGIPNLALAADQILEYRHFKEKMKNTKPTSVEIYSKKYLEFRRVYDTTEYGKSNEGHTFGDDLTTDERKAVIEFLKSISGEGVLSQDDV